MDLLPKTSPLVLADAGSSLPCEKKGLFSFFLSKRVSTAQSSESTLIFVKKIPSS